jgi:ferredoxin-fold anticodon binding domain-containing protein
MDKIATLHTKYGDWSVYREDRFDRFLISGIIRLDKVIVSFTYFSKYENEEAKLVAHVRNLFRESYKVDMDYRLYSDPELIEDIYKSIQSHIKIYGTVNVKDVIIDVDNIREIKDLNGNRCVIYLYDGDKFYPEMSVEELKNHAYLKVKEND